MNGSGLADLWERVYAKGSVVHMLTGHAFSRAVRAHILTMPALLQVFLEDADWESNIDKDSMTRLYQDTVKQDQHPDTVDNEILQHFEQLLVHDLGKAAKHFFLHPSLWQHCRQQVPQPNNIRFEHMSLCRNGWGGIYSQLTGDGN